MPGPVQNHSERDGVWNVQSLKEYFEMRIHESDSRYVQRFDSGARAVEAALAAADKAAAKAEEGAERWRQASNEWRGALDDREKKFASADAIEGVQKELAILRERFNLLDGRGRGLNAGWAYLAGAVGLLTGVISLVIAMRK